MAGEFVELRWRQVIHMLEQQIQEIAAIGAVRVMLNAGALPVDEAILVRVFVVGRRDLRRDLLGSFQMRGLRIVCRGDRTRNKQHAHRQ